jgi:hypothetical protein
MKRSRLLTAAPLLGLSAALVAWALPDAGDDFGLRLGAPAVQSLGAMTFGPGNVLFIGDSEGAQIHAIEIADATPAQNTPIDVTGIDARIAQALGTAADQILIHDLAVHPQSRNVYLTVTRGRGEGAQPALLRVKRDGAIESVPLESVRYSTAAIPNAPAPDPQARRNPRTLTVTDLAFAEGRVFVAGLSNEEFSSAFRQMPFPFAEGMQTTTLEIYHVSHGRNETNAPVMTFLPKRIGDSLYMLAAYTCTPLVAFPMDALKDGDHVVGRTVAELGSGNQPLDMIAFTRDGQEQILIANSRHPLMRVSPSDIANAPALVSPTEAEGIARVPLARTGITQLDDLNADFVVVLQRGENGIDLRSIAKTEL